LENRDEFFVSEVSVFKTGSFC